MLSDIIFRMLDGSQIVDSLNKEHKIDADILAVCEMSDSYNKCMSQQVLITVRYCGNN